MNTAHWHLVLNHFPIIGTMIIGIVLTIAIITKNKGMTMSSYAILFLLSVIAFIVNQTGEGAEEAVENLTGINKWALHEHEEFAETSIIIHMVTGVLAVFALILSFIKKVTSRLVSFVVLLLTFITIGFMSYTGYLGGQIRHTETSSQVQNNAAADPTNTEDED
jgi:uncharacterized membrane protein